MGYRKVLLVKMFLYVFATFFISLVASYSVLEEDFLVLESDAGSLAWPDRYTVKARKLTLTSDLVEDFVAWRNNQSSRVDYNQGAVKVITDLTAEDEDGDIVGKKYEVHPETSDGENSDMVCMVVSSHSLIRSDFDIVLVELDSILPAVEKYDDIEAVGNETINGMETVKFEYIDEGSKRASRKTIWAVYKDFDDEESGWIPVRYENIIYNAILDSLRKHEIWDFFEFDTDFDDDVFDVEDFNCDDARAVKHTANSAKITKELMFINPENQKHVDHIFRRYILDFERSYAQEQEHVLRKAIFNQNMRMVAAVNKMNLGYSLSLNQFSDRTPQELERTMGLQNLASEKSGNIPFPYDKDELKKIVSELPDDYDLRLLDLVTPVKNQGQCGSCWTYGTTSAVEGALARVNGGKPMSLSNQALVDCVWREYGAKGCDGGNARAAYQWMMDYGVPTEREYGPYKNQDGICNIVNMTKTYRIRGYTDVPRSSNSATKVALVNHGPLAVSVHVTDRFRHYASGIFQQSKLKCNPYKLSHQVTMVGYVIRDTEPFWILKNSWGPQWGMEGYMLISAKENTCGVTTRPTYVVF